MFFFFSFFRAPVLVAVALIESGMKYEDAIQFIRQYVHLSLDFFQGQQTLSS